MALQWLVSIIHPDGSSVHHPDVDRQAVREYAAGHTRRGDRVEFFYAFLGTSGVEWVPTR